MADNGATPAELPEVAALVKRSVQEPNDSGSPGIDGNSFLLYYAAQAADGITTWGSLPKKRDRELRNFWPTENYLAGALTTVAARNASIPWKLDGPPQSVEAAERMLKQSHYGRGWSYLWTKVGIDYLSQDSGGFIQFIRLEDSPLSPVVNITHLDAWRMFPTGDPENPYLYLDRKNRYHRMKWYQVFPLLEIPAPVEHPQGPFVELQYCAVTRVLRAAQILRNIAIYKDEKTSGRFLRAIHLLSGVSRQEVQDAINEQRLQADQQGLMRYINPLMISALDPQVPVSSATIELASLPDGFDEEKTMKNYVMALAMGFLTDYQEFAPLPGGGIGTGAQSETLAQKSRGKGVALWKMLIEHIINNFVLPENVTFSFNEQDVEQDQKDAVAALTRAQVRAAMKATGEIDELAAREIAVKDGDLDEEMLADLESRDAERIAKEEEQARMQFEQQLTMAQMRPGMQPAAEGRKDIDLLIEPAVDLVLASVKSDDCWTDWDEQGSQLGEFLQTRIHRAFTMAADDLAGLGYMDTEGRINLSGIIGDALRYFVQRMDEDAPEISYQWVPQSHLEELLKSLGSFGAEARVAEKSKFPPSRKKLEEAVTDDLEGELDDLFQLVTGRIEQLRSEEKATKPKKRRTRERVTVERGSDRRMTGYVKDIIEE